MDRINMLKRWFNFLDGKRWLVDENTCRGCFMEKHKKEMPPHLLPIFKNNFFTVRQDAEWPIPGFYILSVNRHIPSIVEFNREETQIFGSLLKLIRWAMKETLHIERAQIYHEEKLLRPHFHQWILPLWPDMIQKSGIHPKIYDSNIKQYIDLFNFAGQSSAILECNQQMRRCLKNDPDAQKLAIL